VTASFGVPERAGLSPLLERGEDEDGSILLVIFAYNPTCLRIRSDGRAADLISLLESQSMGTLPLCLGRF
jgi:hypothetical protein